MQVNLFVKKGWIIYIAILFLLSLSTVTASKDKVFEDYVESGSLLKINDVDYSIYVSSSYITISGGTSRKILISECETADNLEFCYLAKTDTRALVSISYLLPDLTVERTLDDNEVYIGEDSDINILISNDGDYEAKDIVLTDEFPIMIEVKDTSGPCSIVGNKVIFTEDRLDVGDEIECSFKIRPSEVVDLGLTAEYTYFDGVSTNKEYTNKITIKSETGVETIISATEDHNVGDEFSINIELENNNINDFDTTIRVIIPDKVELDDEGSFEVVDGELYDEFELRDSTIKTYTADFTAKKPGTSEFIIFITYVSEKEGIIQTETYNKRITIEKESLEILTNFENDNENVESGQTILLDFEVRNPNKDMKFKNVEVSFSSPLFYIEPTYFNEIGPEKRVTILDRIFEIPVVDKKTRYEIGVDINYETEYGEKGSVSEKKYITIDETGTLSVDHEIEGIPQLGEEVEINTNVISTKYVDVDLACIEEKFEGFEILRGLNRVCFDIESNSEEELLKYKLKITDPHKGKIITTITYEADEQNYTKFYEKEYDFDNLEVENSDLEVDLDTDESTYYQGEIFSIQFQLKNDFTKPVYNVTLDIPKFVDFDYYSENVSISKVNPGETITLNSAFKIRGKTQGTFPFENMLLESYSEDGIKYITKINKISIKITNTSLDSQALIMQRNLKIEGNNSKIEYIIRNVGNKDSSAVLKDESINLEKGIFVPKNSQITVSANLNNLEPEIINGTYAIIEYDAVGKTKTYSNQMTYENINIIEPEINNIEDDNITIIPENNTEEIENITVINQSETKENLTVEVIKPKQNTTQYETKKKKNLISEIIKFIMSIFGVES